MRSPLTRQSWCPRLLEDLHESHIALFRAVEHSETGVVVVAPGSKDAVMVNARARQLLGMNSHALPTWFLDHIRPMQQLVLKTGSVALNRVARGDQVLRVRVRRLREAIDAFVVELRPLGDGTSTSLRRALEQQLQLSRADSDLILGLWHGHSNREIAERMELSVNTLKARVRSLYRRLGVSARGEAVLRVAEVASALAASPS